MRGGREPTDRHTDALVVWGVGEMAIGWFGEVVWRGIGEGGREGWGGGFGGRGVWVLAN